MKYRKRPSIIEAVQWKGDNYHEIVKLRGDSHRTVGLDAVGDLFIETLEGRMKADLHDFVIKGIAGELYPSKPNIFNELHERVHDSESVTTIKRK